MSTAPVTIFGIDPGFDRLGWSVGQVQGDKLQVLAYGLIETKRSATLFERYADLAGQLDTLIAEFAPQEAALESLFYFSNQKTVIPVAQARGVVLSCFLRARVKCFEYTPPQIKLAVTGHGRADKRAVEKMTRALLRLDNEKVIDDTIDALAVLATHSAARKLLKAAH